MEDRIIFWCKFGTTISISAELQRYYLKVIPGDCQDPEVLVRKPSFRRLVSIDKFSYKWRITGTHPPLILPPTTSWVLTEGGWAGFPVLGFRGDSRGQNGASLSHRGAKGADEVVGFGHCAHNRLQLVGSVSVVDTPGAAEPECGISRWAVVKRRNEGGTPCSIYWKLDLDQF